MAGFGVTAPVRPSSLGYVQKPFDYELQKKEEEALYERRQQEREAREAAAQQQNAAILAARQQQEMMAAAAARMNAVEPAGGGGTGATGAATSAAAVPAAAVPTVPASPLTLTAPVNPLLTERMSADQTKRATEQSTSAVRDTAAAMRKADLERLNRTGQIASTALQGRSNTMISDAAARAAAKGAATIQMNEQQRQDALAQAGASNQLAGQGLNLEAWKAQTGAGNEAQRIAQAQQALNQSASNSLWDRYLSMYRMAGY